jgi:hypothetical protein
VLSHRSFLISIYPKFIKIFLECAMIEHVIHASQIASPFQKRILPPAVVDLHLGYLQQTDPPGPYRQS